MGKKKKAKRVAAAVETRDALREAVREARQSEASRPDDEHQRVGTLIGKAEDAAFVSKKKIARHPRKAKKRLDRLMAKLTEATADEQSVGTAADPELGSLTVVQLRARARESGRRGYSRLRKAQLVEFLQN